MVCNTICNRLIVSINHSECAQLLFNLDREELRAMIFRKAFGVVNHQLLLTKWRLHRASYSTLSWFTSYAYVERAQTDSLLIGNVQSGIGPSAARKKMSNSSISCLQSGPKKTVWRLFCDCACFTLSFSIGGSPETAQPHTIPCSQALSGVISDVKTGLRVHRLLCPSRIPNETAAKSSNNMGGQRTWAVCCFRGLAEIKRVSL